MSGTGFEDEFSYCLFFCITFFLLFHFFISPFSIFAIVYIVLKSTGSQYSVVNIFHNSQYGLLSVVSTAPTEITSNYNKKGMVDCAGRNPLAFQSSL